MEIKTHCFLCEEDITLDIDFDEDDAEWDNNEKQIIYYKPCYKKGYYGTDHCGTIFTIVFKLEGVHPD